MRDKTTTEILSTHTPELFRTAVHRAAELLRAGQLVALPTETVYGLAANALNADAVARIYEVKGRPANNPIIVHVADPAMAQRCVDNWPGSAAKLAAAFWPGPLTLVLPRQKDIPDIVTASGPTVGVRWPSHPFIQAVIRECGFPLAAPSANLSNRVSPTNAGHVRAQLDGKIPLIVDGGQAQVGIESTVLDLTDDPPRVLRPGMIHTESLMAVIGEVSGHPERGSDEKIPRSPGRLEQHYAPRAKLVVWHWRDDDDLRSQLADFGAPVGGCHVIAHSHIPSAPGFGHVSVVPHDAEAYARALYGELHRCDGEGAQLIVAESPPATSEWQAIADRLRRAASRAA
jgi:L-threonylcarbamoyladenylate synthase